MSILQKYSFVWRRKGAIVSSHRAVARSILNLVSDSSEYFIITCVFKCDLSGYYCITMISMSTISTIYLYSLKTVNNGFSML